MRRIRTRKCSRCGIWRNEVGRMQPSAYYDRGVDVMEERVKFTLLTHDVPPYLADRYSERQESAETLLLRMNQRAL